MESLFFLAIIGTGFIFGALLVYLFMRKKVVEVKMERDDVKERYKQIMLYLSSLRLLDLFWSDTIQIDLDYIKEFEKNSERRNRVIRGMTKSTLRALFPLYKEFENSLQYLKRFGILLETDMIKIEPDLPFKPKIEEGLGVENLEIEDIDESEKGDKKD